MDIFNHILSGSTASMNALHRTLQKLVDEVVENAIIGGVQQLITLPFGIGSFIMGGLYSATVVAGVAFALTWMFGYKDKDLAESKK